MLNVHIFIMCYNEETLLPHTIEHYRQRMFPTANVQITLLDNRSTDNTLAIAKQLGGIYIQSFESEGIMNEFILTELRNRCWNGVKQGWVLMIDMDEWINITEADLLREEEVGTTVIETRGYNIVARSIYEDLTDIRPVIHDLCRGIYWVHQNKSLCFRVPDIEAMNFTYGSHSCSPTGRVVVSTRKYTLKHMCWLGLPFLWRKTRERYERSKLIIEQYGLNGHYKKTYEEVYKEYISNVEQSILIPP